MKERSKLSAWNLDCRAASELASDSLDRDLTRGERLALRLHQLPEHGGEIALHKQLARRRRFPVSACVGEKNRARVLPLLDLFLLPLDVIGGLGLDGITVGHLDCRRQHLSQ